MCGKATKCVETSQEHHVFRHFDIYLICLVARGFDSTGTSESSSDKANEIHVKMMRNILFLTCFHTFRCFSVSDLRLRCLRTLYRNLTENREENWPWPVSGSRLVSTSLCGTQLELLPGWSEDSIWLVSRLIGFSLLEIFILCSHQKPAWSPFSICSYLWYYGTIVL